MSGTARRRRGNDEQSEEDAREGARQLDRMVSDVEAGVADLLNRLPGDAGILELTMAEGTDPDGLEEMLASLPDDAELAALASALNDPAALERLLATADPTKPLAAKKPKRKPRQK